MPQGFNGSCPSMYNFIEPLYCDVSSGPVVLEKKRQTSRATGQMNDPIYAPAFYPLVHYRLWLGSHGAGLETSDPKLKRFFFCFGSSSHYGSWALARFSNTFETWSPRKLFQCIACTQTFNDNIITFSCKSMQFPSKLMLFTYFRPPDQTFLPPTKMFLQLFWHSNYFWPPDQFFFYLPLIVTVLLNGNVFLLNNNDTSMMIAVFHMWHFAKKNERKSQPNFWVPSKIISKMRAQNKSRGSPYDTLGDPLDLFFGLSFWIWSR